MKNKKRSSNGREGKATTKQKRCYKEQKRGGESKQHITMIKMIGERKKEKEDQVRMLESRHRKVNCKRQSLV